ncbi:MAG: 3-dehydroquinate synthase [Gammaproteobacteria bacterium]|nr:3-dehydroquinate synthase [Gammaproteobacteria bacterium]
MRVQVHLGERSYPIEIGHGLIGNAALLGPYIAGQQVAVVTNSTVAPLYLERLQQSFPDRCVVDVFVLDDGEQYKTLESYTAILDFLMQHRHNRSTTLVALGGGVVGDITGFVAATFQRGVNYIQIPTTLLAQVDSSVGGKTAVNHPRGKNMIGAFYQPVCVIADMDTLATLAEREFVAGLAEIYKYGVIWDAKFFDWLEDHVVDLRAKDAKVLQRAVQTSCEIKARVVAEDEREQGLRAILNYGHTFGHALETVTEYKQLLHGEAVAIGMVLAADCSERHGLIASGDAARIERALSAAGLPTRLPRGVGASAMFDAMGMDKKVVDGKLRLVLAERIGSVKIVDAVNTSAVLQTLGNER